MKRKNIHWITLAIMFVMATAAWGIEPNFFGPESFAVGKGKPVSSTRAFTARSGSAILTLENGTKPGDKRVSTGSIFFNGAEIVFPADFNQQVGTIVRSVTLKDNNMLSVNVGGAPGSFVTLSITPGEGPPPPSAPTARLQADPQTISSGGVATLSWTTTNAERVTIVPEPGVVSLAGSVQVHPTQTTLYRLVAEGPGGQAVAETTIVVTTPKPLGITFAPYKGGSLAGATVEGQEITVGGTVVVANPAEIGVTVNGVVAQVNDGNFIANDVPLSEGLNTLTASAIDAAGQVWSASAEVFSLSASKYVTLKADIETGLAPLTVTLSLAGNPTRGVASLSLQCTGPVPKTPVAAGDNTYTVTLDLPGLYACRLDIVDSLGTLHEEIVGINVLSGATLDTLLKAKWAAMTTAMQQGNLAAALPYFSTRTREAYSQQLSSMSTTLSQIVADMQGITLLSIEGDKAIYDLRIVKDGVPFSFQLEFILDEDGLWRIRAF